MAHITSRTVYTVNGADYCSHAQALSSLMPGGAALIRALYEANPDKGIIWLIKLVREASGVINADEGLGLLEAKQLVEWAIGKWAPID